METKRLPNGTIVQSLEGKLIEKYSIALGRWKAEQGYIPSDYDIRLMGIDNYKTNPEIVKNIWHSSTLSATSGNMLKIILPYDNSGLHKLTEPAALGLELIDTIRKKIPSKEWINDGISLDNEDGWSRYKSWDEKDGVYTFDRRDVVLNTNLTETEAMKHPLVLTKLGHPMYVDSRFSKTEGEVEHIIHETFKIGKDARGLDKMMEQYLPRENSKRLLSTWMTNCLDNWASSCAWSSYDNLVDHGKVLFVNEEDTAGLIYSTIKDHISSTSEPAIKKALNDLVVNCRLKEMK